MFSICLIYSNDRLDQAKQVLEYLSMIPYYHSFDKIMVCDGTPNFEPDNFRQVVVHRRDPNFFCRADLWNAGLKAAKKNIAIVMDCDRIPHQSFFIAAATLSPMTFISCRHLFQIVEPVPTDKLFDLITNPFEQRLLRRDYRVTVEAGTIKAAKSPMSGCVAFWRDTYFKTGGLDNSFCGWGFNDTDYYMSAYMAGCEFKNINCPELHIYHGYSISKRQLLAMNAWNGVKFYDKWRLPVHSDIVGILNCFKMTPTITRGLSLPQFLAYVEEIQ